MEAKSSDIPTRFEGGWLGQLDGRMTLAKELRQRYNEVCRDLGGVDRLSYACRSLVERALWLEYWLSQQEGDLAKGEKFDVSRWIQAANSLQGIYSRIGLERKARDAPDLQTYLRSRDTGETA